MPRPLNPDSGRYDLKATPDQLRRWAKAARMHGLELATWVRIRLDEMAARDLGLGEQTKKGRKR